MNDEGVKKNDINAGDGQLKRNPLYKKMELLIGSDEKGKYWEIRPRTFTEVLREADLIDLSIWIARELRFNDGMYRDWIFQIDVILKFHPLDEAENFEDQSTPRKVVRALRHLEKKIAVIENELRNSRQEKWRSYDIPDDFHDLLIAEVELSSGSKDYFLCVIDDRGQMVDPEGNDLGWDEECISRWVPFDEFLTWANGGES
ncbi:MAG: hypothetical protein WBV68_08235 [Exiguobacterium oxidotolerans]